MNNTQAPVIDYERRYIRTRSDGKFFALEPEHGDIRIDDIAHGLANNCRWGGQCLQGLSAGLQENRGQRHERHRSQV